MSIIISSLVRGQRVSSFASRYIEGHGAAPLGALHQPRRLQALLAAVMPQGTENQPRLDSGLPHALPGGAVHGFYYLFRLELLVQMQQRSIAKLDINKVI